MSRPYKLLAGLAFLIATPVGAQADPIASDDHVDLEDVCPLAVRGVDMSIKHLPGGAVELDFVAPSTRQRSDLQKLLREASAMIEYESKVAALRPDEQLTRDGLKIPAVNIDVKLTKRGARLTIKADEPKDAPAVLVHAESFKQFWDANTCIHGNGTQNT